MKKLTVLLLAFALILGAFAGCAGNGAASSAAPSSAPSSSSAAPSSSEAASSEPASSSEAPSSSEAASSESVSEPESEPVTIRLAGLKGPTSMGMVKLLEDNENGETVNHYDFTMAAAADEITPRLVQGDLDIVAVPANLASVLYNNTNGAVQLLAINTLGVIYIAEKGESVQSIADLKGKTIYATGKGSTPEYALRYILSENGLDPDSDVTVEWKSEPTEVVGVLASQDEAVAMLPQPFVTVAQTQVEGLRVAIDLNQAWKDLDNGSLFLTGVLVVRKAFAEENPEAVAAFLEEYEASTQFVNENVEEAAQLVEKYDIVKAPIAQKAIPFCNITFMAGDEMQTAAEGYLQVLFDQEPKSVGGTMPADDFYYKG